MNTMTCCQNCGAFIAGGKLYCQPCVFSLNENPHQVRCPGCGHVMIRKGNRMWICPKGRLICADSHTMTLAPDANPIPPQE